MTSDVNDIFSRFYASAEDYNLVGLDEEVVNELLSTYLQKVISHPLVRRLFNPISYDQDVGEVEYTMREPWDDGADQDFTEELLGLGIMVEWLGPKYHSVKNISQMFTNKEQTYFSQANHMGELREMYTKAKTDLRKLIRDRGYSLSYVNAE